MTYKSSSYRSFKIYSQRCGLIRNTINSPQNLCYHKFSNSIFVSSHRFDERWFMLLPAQNIPVDVQLTSQLILCNSGLGWKKKKELFLMQLNIEEHGNSNWNLITQSCLQSSKYTKLAMFSGSEGFKPNQCFLTTWSHIYHGGLAPGQTKGSGF